MSLAARKAAVRVLADVFSGNRRLEEALQQHTAQLPEEHRPWVRSASYEALRHWPSVSSHWQKYVKKIPKDPIAQAILNLGTTQIRHLKTPAYAAVDESVKLTRALHKPHLSGLVNSVLRKVARDSESQSDAATPENHWNHPRWWIEKVQQQWPGHWQSLLQANNTQAPFWLRHNRLQPAATEALKAAFPEARQHPHIASAWRIDARPVEAIPGFAEGHFSVQDAHAQLAAQLLDPQNGERILDACAAPGGKTGHLWERAPQAWITAVDVQPERLQRIQENLQRLQPAVAGQPVTVAAADVGEPARWPQALKDNAPFDRILLDVPCSASGVVRRHPDIKLARQPQDITAIGRQQARILDAAASLLKPGGHLLYATCSVFDEENEQQMQQFAEKHPEFSAVDIDLPGSHKGRFGVQLLPQPDGGDGFYYALLKKTTDG